jgi:hypothetical protein
MNAKILARSISRFLLVTALLPTAGSALAQEQGRALTGVLVERPATSVPPSTNSCPAPVDLILSATTPNLFNGDFPPALLANHAWLNDSSIDKPFIHTFAWNPGHKCCQITKAVLTVRMQANQGGRSTNSSDAGNDNITLMHLGAAVLPYNERVFSSWPFPAGQQTTKTWNLTGTALAIINSDHHESFLVEDDTQVKSATLQLIGCCLAN